MSYLLDETDVKSILIPILALLLSACTAKLPVPPLGGNGYLQEHVRHADDLLHHDDEILVLDPPADYLETAKSLGLEIIDVTQLAGLGLPLYHMQIVTDHHPLHIRDLHETTFPGVVMDVHHHFGGHATAKGKAYTGRAAVEWRGATAGCGADFKMGMVDSGVATNHPAFAAKKIIARTFILKNQREASREHGTAVASVLIGNRRWGGMMPGATLYAAAVFHKSKKNKVRASSKSILHALAWMIDQKVDLINISLGGARNAVVRAVVQGAAKRGIVMIASVGNDGPFTKKKMYPAAYKGSSALPHMIASAAPPNFPPRGTMSNFRRPASKFGPPCRKAERRNQGRALRHPSSPALRPPASNTTAFRATLTVYAVI